MHITYYTVSHCSTFQEAHGHGAWRPKRTAVDAQLAVAVVPPAPQTATARRGARVEESRGNGRGGDACGVVGCAEYLILVSSPELSLQLTEFFPLNSEAILEFRA